MAKPLSADLRELRDLFRHYVNSHQRPTIDACRNLTLSLSLAAEKADQLELRAAEATEMEEIARDIDMVASAAVSPSLQAALKADQLAIQCDLDASDQPAVSRPALAALAMPIGDSNVFVFPVAPQPRTFDGGDAA